MTRRARRSSRPTIVADFESVGWTVRAEPFRAGEIEIPDGIQCVWGDFSVGHRPRADLRLGADRGRRRIRSAGSSRRGGLARRGAVPTGVIVTESSDTTVATDDEGYGLTYLFGDGWVKYADTKQGLILIVWPSS